MSHRNYPASIVLLASCLGCHASFGAIRNTSIFTTTPIDTFHQYQIAASFQSLAVLGGGATITNRTTDGAIKIEWSSSLGGDLVRPLSGMMMGQLGIADWQFTQPIRRFGAYFANNSGKNDGTAYFYDAADNLIGTITVNSKAKTGHWFWNGWESDTPFTRMRVVGNGLINGFLWYEDVRVSEVPAASTLPLLLLGLVGSQRRRR